MKKETALVAVRCPVHNVGMIQRPLSRQTKEQQWCGAWWDCPEFRCGCSILFQSPELAAQLAEMSYQPRPIIMWKLSRKDASRIACKCGRPARWGSSENGGAPYLYDCSKCAPTGRPVTLCHTRKELVAAVEARNA